MEYFARTVANSESFGFSSKRLDWDITKVVKVFKINGKEIDSNEDGVWIPRIVTFLIAMLLFWIAGKDAGWFDMFRYR